MMTLSPNRRTSSTLVISVLIAALSLESSLAFLQSGAYSFPSSLSHLKVNQPHQSTGFHAPSTTTTSLSATKCPPEFEFSVLDIATEALSNQQHPSYPLPNKNPHPFENPEIRQKNPFQSNKQAAPKSETKSSTAGTTAGTFNKKSQLNTYQPFWMKTGDTPIASTSPPPPRKTQAIDPRISHAVKSYAASFPATAVPTPKVSKTIAIRKSTPVATTKRPSEDKNRMASGVSDKVTTKQAETSRTSSSSPASEIPLSAKVSETFSKPNKSDPVPLSFGGSTNHKNHVASAVGDKDTKMGQSQIDPKQAAATTKKNGTREIKKQWHYDEIPSAVASTGAKVVETLAKAYAHHPLAAESLPTETKTSSAVAPSSSIPSSLTEPKTEQKSNDDDSEEGPSIDRWDRRLKAIEEAVTSLAQGNLHQSVKEMVVDTSASSLPIQQKEEKNDWNLIAKLRNKVEALQDTLFDLQQYETKTISWSIPKIDKHIRLSSSTTFQSDPFYVGSIPFHMEVQVQEASAGGEEEQSVSFFLYHHHYRSQYHPHQQSQYHLRPFQNERSSRKVIGAAPPIHIGGSKLKIGEFEYPFGDSAYIEVGKQDGWGWKHLMSLKELRDYKCIKRGHLDMQFQVRMERENHDRSSVGVSMIS